MRGTLAGQKHERLGNTRGSKTERGRKQKSVRNTKGSEAHEGQKHIRVGNTRASETHEGQKLQQRLFVASRGLPREREIFIDNLLVRVYLIIEMSRPALRYGSLNSLFQVALYLGFAQPSSTWMAGERGTLEG